MGVARTPGSQRGLRERRKAAPPQKDASTATAGTKTQEEAELYGLLSVEPLELVLGQHLVPLVGGEKSVFMERIVAFRKQQAPELGFVFPRVRMRDNKRVGPNHYEVCLYGTRVAEGEILADRWLAITAKATATIRALRLRSPVLAGG